MLNDELKMTKTNFIQMFLLKKLGYTKENPTLEEAIEFLNAHGIPMKNGEMSFEDYVRFAKESGYDGIDMMSYHLEIEGCDAKQILDKYGITLSAVNIIVPFVSANTDEKFNTMLSVAKTTIDKSFDAGCRNILLMPSVYNADSRITREQAFHNMARGLTACVAYGESKGITINTETLESIAVPYCSCGEMDRVFKAVPRLKYNHDTGNPLVAMEDPIETYKLFKDKVVSVHFKDLGYVESDHSFLSSDGRHLSSVPFGEGMVDFKEHLKLLMENQYEGFITIEGSVPAENSLDGAIKSLKYFKELEYGANL
jgi:sugar phosphate isomerase/epimerase